MKIKTSLKLFIYFSVFLHLLGGVLYYYYKNPGSSFFTKKEEPPVSKDMVPFAEDSTVKEVFVDSLKPERVKRPLPEVPIKEPFSLPETETEPIEIKDSTIGLLTKKSSLDEFDSEVLKTKEEPPLKKNKNVKIFFGSDASKSSTEKSTAIPTASNLSDEASFAGNEIVPPSLKETLPSDLDTEKVNTSILPEDAALLETQKEEPGPDPEAILSDNEELDLSLKELTIPDTPTESSEKATNTEKTDTIIPPEEMALSETQEEESDLNLEDISLNNEESDPLIEELTTSSTPTESLQKETPLSNTKQMNPPMESKPLNAENIEDNSSPEEPSSLETEKADTTIPSKEAASLETQKEKPDLEPEATPSDNDESDLSLKELTIPDSSTKSLQKETNTDEIQSSEKKTSFSFQNFLNLKQRSGNPGLTYPQKARQIKAQGSLSLIFYVTSEGLVEKIQIESSSGHRELDNSVVQTFARYKFLPNQEGWVRHKVDFRLKGEKVEFLRLREK